MVQEGPQSLLTLEQFWQVRTVRLFKFSANLSAVLPHVFSFDLAGLPAVPVLKKSLQQAQQERGHLGTGAGALDNGGEIIDNISPTDLRFFERELVIGRESITHHNAAKGRGPAAPSRRPSIGSNP